MCVSLCLGHMAQFRSIVVAGTFWPIHKGHRAIMERAFNLASEVFIGLTSDSMTRSKELSESIPPYGERKRRLIAYLAERGYLQRAHIFRIEDEYGFAADFPSLEAIVVTPETLGNAQKINRRRVSRGMKPLELVVQEMVLAENGKPISSTRIRRGEIDPEGRVLTGPGQSSPSRPRF